MYRRILNLIIAVIYTAGFFWAVENIGFGNKLSMVFSTQSMEAPHNDFPESVNTTEQSSNDLQAAVLSGEVQHEREHGTISAGSMLKNLLSYSLILSWIVMAVFYIEKLLRNLLRRSVSKGNYMTDRPNCRMQTTGL